MVARNNINVVRRLFDFFNRNDPTNLHVLDELLAHHVQLHDPAVHDAKVGLEGMKQAEVNYFKAFPHKVTTIDDILAADDVVTVRWTVTGKHDGPFQGMAPTHRQFKISGISIYRIANGKITEIWQQWDRLGLLEQLGAFHAAHAH